MNPFCDCTLSLIACVADNGVIGYENKLPWHLPADLKHFKKLTLGKPIVMGRKTFESIDKKPLPRRRNMVISSQLLAAEGFEFANSLQQALQKISPCQEVMLIGGAKLFAETINFAQRMYLTFVHHDFVGDTFFPKWNANEWREINREDHQPDEKNIYSYSYVTLEHAHHCKEHMRRSNLG